MYYYTFNLEDRRYASVADRKQSLTLTQLVADIYKCALEHAFHVFGEFEIPDLFIVDAPNSSYGCLGQYRHCDNSIEIQIEEREDDEIYDVLLHELTHAYLVRAALGHEQLFKKHERKIGTDISGYKKTVNDSKY